LDPTDADAMHALRLELRAKLLEVASPLGCRPEPRSVWDDLARPDAWRVQPERAAIMCRVCLTIARRRGPRCYAAVYVAVRAYREAEERYIFAGFDLPEAPLLQLTPLIVRELSQAQAAITEEAIHPTPAHRERALHEVLAAELVLDRAVRSLGAV
jgi:hypothetical protein